MATVQRALRFEPEIGALVFSRSFPAITRHTLALYCGASGDSNPIHVDKDFAEAAGFPDVFAHGMLVMAYLGEAIEEAGLHRGLKTFGTRFVSITQLGAQITCEASVVEVDDCLITLDVMAADETGDVKLKGRATVDRSFWREKFD
jgi:acyl dehydratase